MFSQDVRSLVPLEGNQNLLLSGGEHIAQGVNYQDLAAQVH